MILPRDATALLASRAMGQLIELTRKTKTTLVPIRPILDRRRRCKCDESGENVKKRERS